MFENEVAEGNALNLGKTVTVGFSFSYFLGELYCGMLSDKIHRID